MNFTILTLFPEILENYFAASIMARAVKAKKFDFSLVNIRDFAYNRHKSCDDAPYGGGAGMVLSPEPLAEALDSLGPKRGHTLYLSPSGTPFTQRKAEELACKEQVTLICGRYEGIDQRVVDLYVDEEISIGEYVLSSGEVAALVVVDTVYRLIDGIISPDSLNEESFNGGLLEYPHYTRPEIFKGLKVPDILLSGHHEKIERWRLQKRIEKTAKVRPELLKLTHFSDKWRGAVKEFLDKRERGVNNESDKEN